MSASVRAASAANNGAGGTTLTVSRPTGTTDGDALYMAITARGGTGTTITPPGKIASRTSPFGSSQINDVASNGSNLFVAVAHGSKLATSTDGSSWTLNASHPFTGNIICVGYGNGIWFAADSSGKYATATDPTATWTQRTYGEGNTSPAFAEYVNGFYVIGGTNASRTHFWVSSDAITWSEPSTRPGNGLSAGVNIATGCAFADGLYAAVVIDNATSSTQIWTASTITGTWTQRATTILGSGIGGYGPVYRNGIWVIGTRNGSGSNVKFAWIKSPTLPTTSSWNVVTTSPFSASMITQRIKSTPEGFVQAAGVSGSPGELAYSNDGITWRLVDTSGVTDPLLSSAWDDTAGVVVVTGSTGKLHSGNRQWILLSRTDSTTTLAQAVYYRVANQEPASYGVTLTSAKASAICVAVQAGGQAEALGVGGQANASSTSITAPAIGTWTAYGSGLDLFFGGTAFGTTVTPPGSYTEPTNGEASSTPADSTATTTELATRYLNATSVGSIAATAGSAAVNIGHHVFVPDSGVVLGSVTADAAIVTWSRWSSTWSNPVNTGSGSFTADAIIKKNQSGSFTADAVVKKTQSGSFTGDAIKRVVQSGSFTANAIVFKTVTGSFTADAVIKKTISGSFTADAVIKKTQTGSFTADAVIKKTISGSFTADAVIFKTQLASFTANAVVKKTQSGSFALDAIIVRTTIGSFAADAIIFKTIAGSFTANAIIFKTQTATFSVDAIVRIGRTGSFTADAVLLRVQLVALTADAVIFKTLTGSFTANAVLMPRFFIDAIVRRVQSGSFTANAIIMPRFSVDAIVRREQAGSFTVSAFIAGSGVAAFGIDAVIKSTQSNTFSTDAVLRAGRSVTFTASAVIRASVSSSLAADAVIRKTQTSSFTADAVVRAPRTVGVTANAVILSPRTASFTVDAVIAAAVASGGSFTANAVIKRTQTATATADAVIKRTDQASFIVSAFISAMRLASFGADAVIRAERTASFTAAAIVLRASGATFDASAILRATASASFTLDAEIVGLLRFTIDAVIRGRNEFSFTIGAVITRLRPEFIAATLSVDEAAATITSSFARARISTSERPVGSTLTAQMIAATVSVAEIGVTTGVGHSFTVDAVIVP